MHDRLAGLWRWPVLSVGFLLVAATLAQYLGLQSVGALDRIVLGVLEFGAMLAFVAAIWVRMRAAKPGISPVSESDPRAVLGSMGAANGRMQLPDPGAVGAQPLWSGGGQHAAPGPLPGAAPSERPAWMGSERVPPAQGTVGMPRGYPGAYPPSSSPSPLPPQTPTGPSGDSPSRMPPQQPPEGWRGGPPAPPGRPGAGPGAGMGWPPGMNPGMNPGAGDGSRSYR